tara:strand:- start:2408 stop:2812 length:405 start_codon:yes stop_codon:yes gene_type:complete
MNSEDILKELRFKASRSSGAGGQHVNKVSSKIELTFNLEDSISLSKEQKLLLIKKLSAKITKENNIIIYCEQTRSQHRNKDIAIKKFLELLKTGLTQTKRRRATKPSRASIRKKSESKKRISVKKVLRKKPKFD